jgi:large subunit ribosomal protein L18
MADSSRYSVKFRRRREKKTDYRKRIAYLKSKNPRFVVRKTGKNLHIQIVEHHPKGDKTIFEASASELKKFGFKGNLGTTPASYLTGYLLSKKAKDKLKSELTADFGLSHPTSERLLAAVKGAVDGGLKMNLGKTHLKEDRVKGKHLKLEKQVEDVIKKIEGGK